MYSLRLKLASAEYDNDHLLSIDGKIDLYRRMMEFSELVPFAMESITKMVNEYDGGDLNKFDVFNLGGFKPREKTFYEDKHNVHGLTAETVRIALLLIKKWPAKYYRPESLRMFDRFFRQLEGFDFSEFDPKLLFASIWRFIKKSPHSTEIELRLREEMLDANGMCLTGFITRLINTLRGFDTEFETTVDEYEYERAKAFHDLNRNINPYEPDIRTQIMTAINNKTVKLPRAYALRILKAYTGDDWKITS